MSAFSSQMIPRCRVVRFGSNCSKMGQIWEIFFWSVQLTLARWDMSHFGDHLAPGLVKSGIHDLLKCRVMHPWRVTQWTVVPGRLTNAALVSSTLGCQIATQLPKIGPKWDKSGDFKDQFRYNLSRRAKMYWNWSYNSQISTVFDQSEPIWG